MLFWVAAVFGFVNIGQVIGCRGRRSIDLSRVKWDLLIRDNDQHLIG